MYTSRKTYKLLRFIEVDVDTIVSRVKRDLLDVFFVRSKLFTNIRNL